MSLSRTVLTALFALSLLAGVGPAAAAPDGAQLVTSKGCIACHGVNGEGQAAAGFPRLAGQPEAYLEAQLHNFASGRRINPVMQPQAKLLTADEIKAAAKYYASLTPTRVGTVEADPKLIAAGREIAVNGLWQKNLPACEFCHGPGARGLAGIVPMLAGQGTVYLKSQLADLKTGKHPDLHGHMMNVARHLSTDEVNAVVAYLSSLEPTGPLPAGTEPDVAPGVADAMPGYFQPPLDKDLPDGEFGEAVKRGYLIFTQTPKYAADYVGNGQSCSNCHLNRGRQANSAPMWGAWGMYPAYRSKNKKVNDMAMRLQGCFTYSENAQASPTGKAPAADSQVMLDLESYMYWVSTGVPTGEKMKGRGYAAIEQPPQPFSRERGSKVYAGECAICHGDHGQGLKVADGSFVVPPLWGPDAYNWGAGMHGVDKAAAFIHHNMPMSVPGKLDIQQTWDVAAWINSQPRPQDPRFNGNLEETIQKFHKKRDVDFYGQTVDGVVLGAGK